MIAESIFKAYDIRGVVDETLTIEAVELIGKAFGSEAQAQSQQTVVIARDGRLSSPKIAKALSEGLNAAGCDVIDIGILHLSDNRFHLHPLSRQLVVLLDQ